MTDGIWRPIPGAEHDTGPASHPGSPQVVTAVDRATRTVTLGPPQDTAPTAPTFPVDAPEVSDGSEVGVGTPEGSQGLPGARRKAGRPKGSQPITAPGSTHPLADVNSRARTQLRTLVSGRPPGKGRRVVVPLPLRPACALCGLSYSTVWQALNRGDLPDVAEARGKGLALCLDMAAREPKTRMWWDLAVTLEPRELHLPNRVQLGGDAESPPVQVAALVVPADPEALRAELRLVQQQIAGLLGSGNDGET